MAPPGGPTVAPRQVPGLPPDAVNNARGKAAGCGRAPGCRRRTAGPGPEDVDGSGERTLWPPGKSREVGRVFRHRGCSGHGLFSPKTSEHFFAGYSLVFFVSVILVIEICCFFPGPELIANRFPVPPDITGADRRPGRQPGWPSGGEWAVEPNLPRVMAA